MVINSHPLYSKGETGRIKGDKLNRKKEFALNFKKLALNAKDILPVATAYLKRIQKAIINYKLNSFASFL